MYIYTSEFGLKSESEADPRNIIIVEDVQYDDVSQRLYQCTRMNDDRYNAIVINCCHRDQSSLNQYFLSKDTLGGLINYALRNGYRVFDTSINLEIKEEEDI